MFCQKSKITKKTPLLLAPKQRMLLASGYMIFPKALRVITQRKIKFIQMTTAGLSGQTKQERKTN
jgi:hypothetical protein